MDIITFSWIDRYELLERIRWSVFNFTSVFANVELKHGPIKPDQQSCLEYAVTAVIEFDGAYEGIVWARCSELLAGRIAGGMRATGPEPNADTVNVALCEMLNVIAGEIRLFLSPGGKEVVLSLPTIFKEVRLRREDLKSGNENLHCSFYHLGEPLHVGMTMKKAL